MPPAITLDQSANLHNQLTFSGFDTILYYALQVKVLQSNVKGGQVSARGAVHGVEPTGRYRLANDRLHVSSVALEGWALLGAPVVECDATIEPRQSFDAKWLHSRWQCRR